MNNLEIVFLGGGGLALEMYDYMAQEGINIVGYCSPKEDETLKGILSWLGTEKEVHNPKFNYVIASGWIDVRKKMINFIQMENAKIFNFKSSKSHISSFAKLNEGFFIAPYACITGNPTIGKYCFMNIYSSISHHSQLGDNIVLNPGARIGGRCIVGNNTIMGANSSLLPETILGEDVEIGINTYPKKTVESNMLVMTKNQWVYLKKNQE